MGQVVMTMEKRFGDTFESKDTIEADMKTGTVNEGKEENNNLVVDVQSYAQQRIILYDEISDDETSEVGELDVKNCEKIHLKKEMKSDPDPGKCCIKLMAMIAKLKEVNKRQKEDLVKSEKLCQIKEEQINLLEQELKLEKPEKKIRVVYDLD